MLYMSIVPYYNAYSNMYNHYADFYPEGELSETKLAHRVYNTYNNFWGLNYRNNRGKNVIFSVITRYIYEFEL